MKRVSEQIRNLSPAYFALATAFPGLLKTLVRFFRQKQPNPALNLALF